MRSARIIKLYFLLWNFLCCTRGTTVKNITSAVARQIRSIGFPENSGNGIYFALSIPVDIPQKSVAVAFYFEANYGLPPENITGYYVDGYITKRNIDRQFAYDILESNLERTGLPGRTCILRAICETAKQSLSNHGLLGDIIHTLLTPSSSYNENLSMDFITAEMVTNCQNHYKECPVNILDFIIQEIT